ncbi:MAG: glycosyltransferase family 39 protein [Armatimonadota bacterium]|nr:glycosyltransferase family 39 protein [Armatimonadota bacterium]
MPEFWIVVLAVCSIGLFRFLEIRLGRRRTAVVIAATTAIGFAAVATGAGVLLPLIVATLLQGVAYGYGRALARGLRLEGEVPQGATAPLHVALGWAMLVVVGLAAGSAGVLTPPLVGAVCLGGLTMAVGFLRAWRGARRAAEPSRDGLPNRPQPSAAWWWGLSVLLLVGLVGAVAPEVRHDALAAHLPIAREFALRGAIVAMPQNTASYLHLNADLLYAVAMLLLPGEMLPKLLHFFAGAAACLLVYRTGARLWDPRVGLLAAAILAGTPLVWWLAATAYTDLWVTLFVAGVLDVVAGYDRRPGAGPAFAAGLLAGAAVGTKMPAVAVVAPLLGVMLWRIAASGRGRDRWRAAAALVAGSVVAGAYWYSRAFFLTGNPFHPLLRQLFGLPPAGGPGPRIFGMGYGVADLLLAPWRTTVVPHRFVEDGSIGVVYLLLAPLALVAIARRRAPAWLAIAFIAAGSLWFFTAQYLRFFVPVLSLATLLAAAGAFTAVRRAAGAMAALTVTALFAVTTSWTTSGGWYFPLGVTAGAVSRDDFAASHVRGYRVAKAAARSLPRNARIVSVGEDLVYHYDRFFVPTSWYGRRYAVPFRRDLFAARTGADVAHLLAGRGYTHLVVVTDLPFIGRRFEGSWLGREALWDEGPRLLLADGDRYLFEVSSPRGPMVPGPSLLHQASADAGRAVEVAVSAGTLYALEAHVRADGGSGRMVLRVEWVDAAGRPLVASPRREVAVGEGWRRVAMAATAPEGAVTARVAVEAAGTGRAQVRAMRFHELR